jgi:hypothetical protein
VGFWILDFGFGIGSIGDLGFRILKDMNKKNFTEKQIAGLGD